MPNILKTVLLSAGFSTLLLGAVGWLCRNLIIERLKNAVAFEYAQKLKAIEHEHDKKLKALEHSYAQQLEKMRVQLQSESSKAKEEMEHDRKVFERLNSFCDEMTFRDACRTITDYQFFDDDRFDPVRTLERYGIQDENQFVNQNLRAVFLKFHDCLAEFTTVVAGNFFNTGGNRYMLEPSKKNSGDVEKRKMYENALAETKLAGNKTLEAFSDYRRAVKQTLFV